MEWTKDAPTKEGWYWICVFYTPTNQHIRIIFIDENQTYYAPIDWDDEYREHIKELGDNVYWMGPLPEPEVPK